MSHSLLQFDSLYETHLPVQDLTRAMKFYGETLGLELARHLPDRRVAFYWVGAKEKSMIGLWEGVQGPLSMSLHLAFRAPRSELVESPQKLSSLGVVPLDFWGQPTDEPVVIGWMPALSVYFKDPDGHSLEMLHVLDEPADADFGIGSYTAWQKREA